MKHRFSFDWSVLIKISILVAATIFIVTVILIQPKLIEPQAFEDLSQQQAVVVQNDHNQVVMDGKTLPANVGLIVYPGAFIDALAYAPNLVDLSASGVKVIIVRPRLNFALLQSDAAQTVMSEYPEISNWYIAGHSLGGVAACKYIADHPDSVRGLILWASYCADDISNQSLSTLSLRGTEDGLTSAADVTAARPKLPLSATMSEITGMNHAQFGSYGDQPGDLPATITDQQATELVTVEMLRSMNLVSSAQK